MVNTARTALLSPNMNSGYLTERNQSEFENGKLSLKRGTQFMVGDYHGSVMMNEKFKKLRIVQGFERKET